MKTTQLKRNAGRGWNPGPQMYNLSPIFTMVVDVACIVTFRLVHLQIQQSIYRRAFRHNEAGRRFGEALCRQLPGWVVAR